MIRVSDLLKKIQVKFHCKKTTFYKRRSELESLGYKLEPKKQGRVSFYSNEQFIVISDYLSYINEGGIPEEYPTFQPNNIVKSQNNNIQTHEDEINTSPQENETRRVDEKSQLEAAKREIMVDYYRTTGNYSIPGLAADIENAKEKIHQGKMARELESIANLIPD
ncbi:MAG: hypothetical protein O4805_19635 [Trichodesmium sp. St16_bin2-tuft]|nr:hypothetical protein [Trichodesmium sp. St18_bin1]MDE5089213.1 hypothetical protein [Trichodesmium sp. St16_bin2-tuft]MDE5116029.1 hypothetical protein [Trichodesmium sp. St2_bin2_1]MDE5124429.1 hypothetical protein [Trichodesmium sp. St19_bin1]